MRKVIFTEQQLKHILGENFMAYLPNKECDTEESPLSYCQEVGTSEKNMDGVSTDTPMTDKISKNRAPKYPMFRPSSGYMAEEVINERNSELDKQGKCITLGKNTNELINNMDSNSKLINNMKNEKGMSHNTATVRKHRLEKMKDNDPEKFNSINGEKLLKAIDNSLNSKRTAVKTDKKIESELGMNDNVFISQHTKGSGTAHTPKGNAVTYFN